MKKRERLSKKSGKHVIFFACAHLLFFFLIQNTFAAETLQWRFETEEHGWSTSSPGITLTVEANKGAATGSESCLVCRGGSTAAGDWNHAISDARPILPGRLYRLEGRMWIDGIEPSGQHPALKCEFLGPDGATVLGRAFTESYDGTREKTWQRLACEFRVPAGITSIRLALDKGAISPQQRDTAVNINCMLDEISIKRIEKLGVSGRFVLDPTPAPLKKLHGRHPRLYLTSDMIDDFRTTSTTTHDRFWSAVRNHADQAVKNGPTEYTDEIALRFPGDEGIGGFQMLWQRTVGDTMVELAAAWLITGEKRYLDSAGDWAVACCSYDYWGMCWMDGMDLAAAHQIFGLAVVYDWCYNDLPRDTRDKIKETLIQRGGTLFQASASEKKWIPRTFLPKIVWANWYNAYLSNHQWIPMCALAAAGMALYDEVPGAGEWIALTNNKFHGVMDALGDDGASHEGASYFGYGVEWLLKYMYLSRQLLGDDLFGTEWFRNTASYRLYLSLPRNVWTRGNNVVDIGDSGRGNGPDFQLYGLASVYDDGYAQWLADEIYTADIGSARNRWLGLFFYDPGIVPLSPESRPTGHHFHDMGLVSSRTDWSGDESLLVFKCGPYMGHEALEKKPYRGELNDADDQHVHPDANHFVLFGSGEWLIRDDTGHRSKWTDQHNTLTVDGRGQLGEGWWYFRGLEPYHHQACPRITHTRFSPEFDQISGDAAEAYPPELGLKRYERHLLFVKPDVLIVVDDIEADRDRALELRFHPENHVCETEGSAYTFNSDTTALRLELLVPDGVTMDAAMLPAEGWHAKPDSLFTVRLATTGREWRNAVALTWSDKTAKPADVSIDEQGDTWTFSVDGKRVLFDWKTGAAKLEP